MFDLRTAAAAALVGALFVASPALAAAPAPAPAKPAPKATATVKPRKEVHGFKRYDKSGDGVMTLAEFKAAFASHPKRLARAEKRFKKWDANGDGKITKAEWDARHKRSKPAPKKKP